MDFKARLRQLTQWPEDERLMGRVERVMREIGEECGAAPPLSEADHAAIFRTSYAAHRWQAEWNEALTEGELGEIEHLVSLRTSQQAWRESFEWLGYALPAGEYVEHEERLLRVLASPLYRVVELRMETASLRDLERVSSPEGAREFASMWGVPDRADGYPLSALYQHAGNVRLVRNLTQALQQDEEAQDSGWSATREVLRAAGADLKLLELVVPDPETPWDGRRALGYDEDGQPSVRALAHGVIASVLSIQIERLSHRLTKTARSRGLDLLPAYICNDGIDAAYCALLLEVRSGRRLRTCQECGGRFVYPDPRRLYCSGKCKWTHDNRRRLERQREQTNE